MRIIETDGKLSALSPFDPPNRRAFLRLRYSCASPCGQAMLVRANPDMASQFKARKPNAKQERRSDLLCLVSCLLSLLLELLFLRGIQGDQLDR